MLPKSPNYTLLSQFEVEAKSYSNEKPQWHLKRVLKWTAAALLALGIVVNLALSGGSLLRDRDNRLSDSSQRASACPQFPAIKAQSESQIQFEKQLTDELASSSFFNTSLKRLQGAVQIPTESFDDMKLVGEDPRWDIFKSFHAYLKETFPLVWSNLSIKTVNTYGLAVTWKGSDELLKPYLFMSHQDVVPVLQATVSKWTYEPYSAHFDGRFVWGRGSVDCKNNLIGILEALETLLSKGYQPKRTILGGFGFDEEISGWQGAKYISEHFLKEWGPNGIDLIVDEGGLGMTELYGATFALPALAEKGYFDVKIIVETAGGHSSIPTDHTAIGILSQIITAIEDTPYSPELTTANPYFTALQCAAEYGVDMDSGLRKKIKAAITSKAAAQEVADHIAASDRVQRYLLKTSQAVDIISGGVKVNALPEKVYAVVNHRIAMESNIETVQSRLTKLVQDVILAKYPMSLDAWGAISGDISNSSTGKVTLENFDQPLNPAPASPYTTDAYRVFSGTVKQVLGKDVVVAPTIMTGNTDTKFYWDLTRNIYRFAPGSEKGMANIHTVDERMGMKEHIEAVRFYAQLMMNGGDQ